MKQFNKLYLTLVSICTIVYPGNVYAWHNELPKDGFNICNKTGKEVKISLDHFYNIRWQVPHGSGWNTKKDFLLENKTCGKLLIANDWGGINKNTKLWVGIKPIDGSNNHVGFDIRSFTNDEHERRGADSNQIRAWNVMNYQSSGDWNAEALIEKSTVYTREQKCEQYNRIIFNHCDYWGPETFPKWQNGSGLIDLNTYGTGNGLSLLTAPSELQEIDIYSRATAGTLPEEMLAHATFELFNKLTSATAKAQSLDNMKGNSINWNDHPNARLCRVYGVDLNLKNISIIHEKMVPDKPIPATAPIIALNNSFDNPSESSIQRLTGSWQKSEQEARTVAVTSGWKYGIGTKLAAKFSALVKEGTAEVSANYEYNAGKSETTTITETRTYILTPQPVTVPPHSIVDVAVTLKRVNLTGNISFDYKLQNPVMRGYIALNGDCNNDNSNMKEVMVKPYNIFKNTPSDKRFDGISSDDNASGIVYLTARGRVESAETGLMFEVNTSKPRPYTKTSIRSGSTNHEIEWEHTADIPLKD